MKTILNKFSFQYHFNNTGPVNKWTLKQERYVNVKKKKKRCQSYISKSQRKYHIQFLEGSISVLVKTVCVHVF